MRMKMFVSALVIVGLGAFLYSPDADALLMDFDFAGTFQVDNEIAAFGFTVDALSLVTVFSSSWDCGDCGLGFDPILAIWDGAGNLIGQQDDGHNVGITFSNAVGYDHGTWDTWFQINLGPGNYTATIGQFNNFAAGANLANGFVHDGDPNFTTAFGPQPFFNGVWSGADGRTGDWEFHLLDVASAVIIPPDPVPEPATMALFAIGLSGLAARRKLRKA